MTPEEEIRQAEVRYQRAFARSEEAREERNDLVRKMLAAGWTHAKVAEATGMSRGRVSQIKR